MAGGGSHRHRRGEGCQRTIDAGAVLATRARKSSTTRVEPPTAPREHGQREAAVGGEYVAIACVIATARASFGNG